MNKEICKVLKPILLGVSIGATTLVQADDDGMRRWQLSLLLNPSDQQIKAENKGRVVIYDGMYSTDIDEAMKEQFDRVEHMMFINTVVTDQVGDPVKDPDTGQNLLEGDDC
jgi:hypothetical protein